MVGPAIEDHTTSFFRCTFSEAAREKEILQGNSVHCPLVMCLVACSGKALYDMCYYLMMSDHILTSLLVIQQSKVLSIVQLRSLT